MADQDRKDEEKSAEEQETQEAPKPGELDAAAIAKIDSAISAFNEKANAESDEAEAPVDDSEAETEKEPESKRAEETKETDADEVPAELIDRALDWGIDKDEAEKLGADVLTRVLTILEEKIVAETTTEPEPKAEPKAEPKPEPTSTDETALGLEDEEFQDPALVKFLKAQKAEIARLAGEVKAMKQSAEAAKMAEHVEWFENGIAELGEPWEDVFGKGSMEEVGLDTEHGANRNKLLNGIIDEAQRCPGRVPSRDVLRKRALQRLWPNHKAGKAKDKGAVGSVDVKAAALKKRAAQRLERASGSAGERVPSGREAAMKAIAEFQRKY